MISFSTFVRAAAAVAALSLSAFPPSNALAATEARVTTEHAESVLAAEFKTAAPGETVRFVFRQELQDGWHVYWRNPGDSGLPLEFNWSLPAGFVAGDIAYPAPERIPVGPFVNFGHHGDPVFLTDVAVPEDAIPGQTATIGLTATWLICEEICVPETGEFEIALPIEAASRLDDGVHEIAARAAAAAPLAFEGAAEFHAGEKSLVLSVDAPATGAGGAFFFPASEGVVEPSAPQQATVDGDRLVVAMAPGLSYDPSAIEALSGVLTVGEGAARRLYEVKAEAAAAPIAVAGSSMASRGEGPTNAVANLPLLLIAAFFGGVVLNTMPCVFPILFVKAASLLGSATKDVGQMRRHGLIYTLGVVATFVGLGGLMLALRAGGEQLGWGFHLQSPIVVGLSAYVLFLVGLNLAGVFNVGEGLQNVGSSLAAKPGDAGAFFTGVLAVFVAAPCIGPLLAAPMGAVVLLPPAAGMLIFVLMALGLAAPYAIVSWAPQIARRLPRPGPWMATLKQALSFPVFAAAAFFVWVLAQQAGSAGLAIALSGLVFISFAAWVFERGKTEGPVRIIWRAAAAAAALAALAPLAGLRIASADAAAAKGGYGAIEAVAYDPSAINAIREDGAGVFVDFTAAWCVTCQFNKATVLSRRSLAQLFDDRGVVLMSADWTRRDPAITDALASFGANGVPLYVYYPAAGDPVVLPLPLSENGIRDAVSADARLAAR